VVVAAANYERCLLMSSSIYSRKLLRCLCGCDFDFFDKPLRSLCGCEFDFFDKPLRSLCGCKIILNESLMQTYDFVGRSLCIV